MRSGMSIVAIGLAFALLSGCSGSNESSTDRPRASKEEVKKEIQEAIDASTDYALQKREEYQKEAEKKLAELKDDYAKLEEQAAAKGQDLKERLANQMDVLQKRVMTAEEMLKKFKKAGEDTWSDAREGMDQAIEDLQESLETVSDATDTT